MIVQPGFLDHWKTRLLVALCEGDETAPFMVLRLWEHCQLRRRSSFENLSDEALRVICRSKQTAAETKRALITAGFLVETDNVIKVHDWSVTNAFIVACWKNGKKGGRPPQTHKKPIRNQSGHNPSNQEEGSGEKQNLAFSLGNGSNSLPPPGPTALDIYLAYPKKEARDDALKAIAKRIKEGKDPALLLERVKTYAKAITWKERRYIPLPATWFNEGRFDDDEAEWHDPSKPKPKPESKSIFF